MFDVTIGPQTTKVECPVIEDMADDIVSINSKLNSILESFVEPRVEFIIGPVSEQKEKE